MSATLISQIVDAAHARGLNQKALAERAGIPKESLSRAKKRGTAKLGMVEDLAKAAGVTLGIIQTGRPAKQIKPIKPTEPQSFQTKYSALAWSNPNASESLLIRRALLKPEFRVLLDAALEFGVTRLNNEWSQVMAETSPEALRARPVTERILGHIHDGYRQATA
jgi:hypothetical protein